jgi:hypothetical protein
MCTRSIVLSLVALAACDRASLGIAVDSPPSVDGGAIDLLPPPRERCNGVDDDGDGRVDEAARSA